MPIDEETRTDLIRRLAIGSIAGQLTWVVIVVVAGLLEPGYSEVRDAVSVLGARDAAHPWLFDIAVAIWGISLIPADCRWTIDATCRAREAAGELSWQRYAHGIAYFYGAVALMLSVFAMAWRFRGDERWGRLDRLSLIGGLIGTLIVAGLFLLGSNEPGGDYGLVQRFALAAGGFWVLVLTVGLLVVHRANEPANAGALGIASAARPGLPNADSRADG